MEVAYVSKVFDNGAPGDVDVTFTPDPATPCYAVVQSSVDMVTWVNATSGKVYVASVTETFTVDQYVRVRLYGGVGPLEVEIVAGGPPPIPTGPIVGLAVANGGTGYTDGSYPGVSVVGGTGSGALADVTVALGIVSGAVVSSGGTGYTGGDSVSVSDASLGGGGGSGLDLTVSI